MNLLVRRYFIGPLFRHPRLGWMMRHQPEARFRKALGAFCFPLAMGAQCGSEIQDGRSATISIKFEDARRERTSWT